MNTALALPEEPPDRCSECKQTLQFHIDNPHGVRYIDPTDIKFIFQPDVVEAPWEIMQDIKTCYIYKACLWG